MAKGSKKTEQVKQAKTEKIVEHKKSLQSKIAQTFIGNKYLSFATIFVLSLLLIFFIFQLYFINKIYPGIAVAGVPIGGLTPTESLDKISNVLKSRLNQNITVVSSNGKKYPISLQDQVNSIQIKEAVRKAYKYGRNTAYVPTVNITLNTTFDDKIGKQLDSIASEVDQVAIDAQLKAEGDQIQVTPSQEGLVIDQQKVKDTLASYINTGTNTSFSLPMKKSYPNLTYSVGLAIKKRLDQIKFNPIKLTYQNQTFPISIETALSFLDTANTKSDLATLSFFEKPLTITSLKIQNQEITDSKLELNQEKVIAYLQSIASQIDKDPREPLFTYVPNSPNRVSEFQAPQEGKKLNITKASDAIASALLSDNTTTIELPVETIPVKNKLTNDLGIKEQIGHGYSFFAGSIPNRVYNVTLGAAKINGVIIAPGETFSFNKTVGDISAATGFKQAYVIKSGRTVLDDGGGICQVSTTLFRAALNAGLPIVERTAHAYRVHYYEENYDPGIDSTIFYPTVDLKFKNDTPGSILIQTKVEGMQLTIDMYGTSDGRVSTISKPVILSRTPAPPELRQDDPTLPKGEVKQVDWAAEGANIQFSRTVVRNGQTLINETFHSNYRPWQAVYLVGTKEN